MCINQGVPHFPTRIHRIGAREQELERSREPLRQSGQKEWRDQQQSRHSLEAKGVVPEPRHTALREWSGTVGNGCVCVTYWYVAGMDGNGRGEAFRLLDTIPQHGTACCD